jgi:hypothetical protein
MMKEDNSKRGRLWYKKQEVDGGEEMDEKEVIGKENVGKNKKKIA